VRRLLLTLLLVTVGAGSLAVADSHAVSPPARVVAQTQAEWLSEMRASARTGDRAARFPSPSRHLLLQRLRTAARSYRFQIVSVRMLHPLQAALVIVIRSDREQSIARATPKIIDLFNPRRPTRADPSGYAYEGYFLVAETDSGVPFLATFNRWRAPHVGGGEWAARESLYPFPHG
jgi:hypothetical protein